MPWHGIYGHDDVVEQFRRALARGRLASSFLFFGPAGIGKFTFALKLAQGLLCTTRPEAALDPCGSCPSCVQVTARTHPDLEIVAKPEDKAVIPVERFIGDLEHRLREGLCYNLSLRPFMGGRKIAVIDDADYLNPEGANCLLKTLEEPPPGSVLILIGTSPARQLPTIRSRCQLVRFQPLPAEIVAQLLLSLQLVADESDARRLAAYSGGSVQQALELAAPELWTFRTELFGWLGEPILDGLRVAGAVMAFVDGAGKEAAARRTRLRQVLLFASEFYRQILHVLAGSSGAQDPELHQAAQKAAGSWRGGQPAAMASLERSLKALEQVDRYVHPATLVESWLDALAAIRLPPGV